MIQEIALLLGVWVLLRLNGKLDRRMLARRKLHSLIHPLNQYLILLDHEMQNAHHHPDPLPSQAVLDHVTELRSFLIRADSRDLFLLSQPQWLLQFNSTLLRIEENLEVALQGEWDEREDQIKSDIKNLLQDFKDNQLLHSFVETRVGLIEP